MCISPPQPAANQVLAHWPLRGQRPRARPAATALPAAASSCPPPSAPPLGGGHCRPPRPRCGISAVAPPRLPCGSYAAAPRLTARLAALRRLAVTRRLVLNFHKYVRGLNVKIRPPRVYRIVNSPSLLRPSSAAPPPALRLADSRRMCIFAAYLLNILHYEQKKHASWSCWRKSRRPCFLS